MTGGGAGAQAPEIRLTRRYRFPASHVLASPALSDAQNRATYGRCANPSGHGHDYALEVTVSGALDPRCARVIAPERLDEIVRSRVLARLDHSLLNEDPWFRDRVPTAENIVLVARRELESALRNLRSERDGGEAAPEAAGPRLVALRLRETRRNTFAWGDHP